MGSGRTSGSFISTYNFDLRVAQPAGLAALIHGAGGPEPLHRLDDCPGGDHRRVIWSLLWSDRDSLGAFGRPRAFGISGYLLGDLPDSGHGLGYPQGDSASPFVLL